MIGPQLPHEQACFHKGRSTVDQGTLLSQDIEDWFEATETAGAVLVDLTAANDTVWHRRLTLKLLQMLPDGHMVHLTVELISYASVKGNLELPILKGQHRFDVESWGVYFQGLVNLDLINFLTMWIFTLCEFRPGESWTNAVYISSENVLNTKIDCSKNVLLIIVVLVEYQLKWMCC